MKKIIAMTLLLCLTLSGCTAKPSEINERLIIEAVGIDIKDGIFTVTLQALDTDAAGAGDNSTGNKEPVKNYVFEGSTVGEALSRVPAATGLMPLYSQIKVIVLSKETAEQKLREALDFFVREYTARGDVFIAVSEGEAGNVVKTKPDSDIIGGKALQNAMEAGKYTALTAAIPLYRFISLCDSENECAYCPITKVRKNEAEKDGELPVCSGTAIFSEGKIKFDISESETRALLFLTGKAEEAIFTVKTDEGIFTLKAAKNRRRLKTDIKNGKPYFEIIINTVCDITEFAPLNSGQLTENSVKKLADAAAEQLKNELTDTLTKIYYENSCDICRFDAAMKLYHPLKYEKIQKSGSPTVKTHIIVNTLIRRTGRETLLY